MGRTSLPSPRFWRNGDSPNLTLVIRWIIYGTFIIFASHILLTCFFGLSSSASLEYYGTSPAFIRFILLLLYDSSSCCLPLGSIHAERLLHTTYSAVLVQNDTIKASKEASKEGENNERQSQAQEFVAPRIA